MKEAARRVLLFTVLLVFVLASSAQAFAANGDTTVYAELGGEYYHRDKECLFLRNGHATSLEAAVRAGMKPCQLCHPAKLDEEKKPEEPETKYEEILQEYRERNGEKSGQEQSDNAIVTLAGRIVREWDVSVTCAVFGAAVAAIVSKAAWRARMRRWNDGYNP